MANSINTNIAAYFAQANISRASDNAASSVARLSSGNRIVKASDDVASLATGTSLQTNISALKSAQSNVSQGSSLLQVADGALAQIQTILQRQKAIALQAGSGSLTNTDRGFLDQEFQALTAQINSLASSTTFNGVQLINGNLETAAAVSATSTQATRASLSTSFTDNIAVGESVIVNGVVLTAGTSSTGTGDPASGTPLKFAVGVTLAETLDNLATQLNDSAKNATYATYLGDAIYTSTGSTLTATARSGGKLSDTFSLRGAGPFVTVSANTVSTTNGSASVAITLTDTTNFKVGQNVVLNVLTKAGIGGITGDNLRGIITANDGTTITFTALASATSTVASTNGAGSLTLDIANNKGEADTTGGALSTSFNMLSVTTGLTSATAAVSADTAVAGSTPFQNGNSITATVNGITKTLYTIGTASDGGGRSLTDIVNGINANTSSTGFRANLVYSSGTYNVRINYDGLTSGPIIFDAGTNYASGTYTLTGDALSATTNLIGTGGHSSIISSGYIDLTGAAGSTGITVANQGTSTVVGASSAAIPFAAADSVSITRNGRTEILYNFIAGDTLNSIVNGINAHTSDTGVYAAVTGTGGGYNIRLYTTTNTPASDQIFTSVGESISTITSSTVTTLTTTNGGLSQTTTASLTGGADDGLNLGSTSVTGSTGDNILTTLSQTKANVDLILTAVPVAGTSTLTVGGQVFNFTSTATANAAPNEILVVSGDIEATLNNAVNTITNYLKNGYALGTTAYELNQIDLSVVNGNTLRFTGKTLDNVTTLASTQATAAYSTVSASITGSSLTNSGALSNAASTYGVDVSGVTNKDFKGSISGFSATYTGTASTVDLSVTIGDYTYTAEDVLASVTSDTRVRFYSNTVSGNNGGYFDVQLDGGNVLAFTNQAGADAVARRLDSAFSSLTFNQERNIDSYTGSTNIVSGSTVIGSLFESKVTGQLEDFDDVKISKVEVTAPSGSNTDAGISLTINGVVFSTANGIGDTLQANQTYRLTSAEDPNQYLDFTLGNSNIDISTADYAAAVQTALQEAFGADAGTAALSFQIGAAPSDTLSVSIGSAETNSLYGGEALSVATQDGASAASEALDGAISTVTSLRAGVGALLSQLNFAAASLQTSIQNQDAARGQLLDTDIATESTAYATEQVKLQAGISVLAQANQQLQALLKLIG